MSLKFEKDREKDKCNQEKYQAILNSLLKDEENKYCADCDAKGPRWASWNLGVFLCIRCAGIHRNLGCHVSRIKSINLDTWKAEQLQMVQEIGNSKARAIYEASVPDSFRRPQNDSALESFIRAKYEHKKYIAKEWVPPSAAYLKAKAKELEDGIEREIKDKKKKRGVTTSASSAIGKLGSATTLDQDHSAQLSFVSGKEVTLVKNPININSTLPNNNHTQQSQDLLLHIDQPTPEKMTKNGLDEFDDFLFAASAPITVPQISGDCLSFNGVKNATTTAPGSLETNNTQTPNNVTMLANVLITTPAQDMLYGGNDFTNSSTKEAILALYGNSSASFNRNVPNANNSINPHHSSFSTKEPFGTLDNSNKFQNSQFQQDYLRQVQNQLASLAVNDTSTKSTLTPDSLI